MEVYVPGVFANAKHWPGMFMSDTLEISQQYLMENVSTSLMVISFSNWKVQFLSLFLIGIQCCPVAGYSQGTGAIGIVAPDDTYTIPTCQSGLNINYLAFVNDPAINTDGAGVVSVEQESGPNAEAFVSSASISVRYQNQVQIALQGALSAGNHVFRITYTPINGPDVSQIFGLELLPGNGIEQFVDANGIEYGAPACSDSAEVTYSFSIYDCQGFDAGSLEMKSDQIPDNFINSATGMDLANTSNGLQSLPVLNGTQSVMIVLTGKVPTGTGYLTIDYRGQSIVPGISATETFAGAELVLVCNDRVNTLLDESDCTAPVLPDNVLEGFPQGYDCLDGYYVKIAYPYDGHSIDYVRKCGEFKYVAYEVNGMPDWVDNEPDITNDYATLPDREICWGYVNAEDKTPPEGCIRKVVGLHKTPVEYDTDGDYFLEAGEAKEVDGRFWQYKPVSCDNWNCSDGILGPELLADDNTNLLICTDLDSIYQVEDSWTKERYAYYTGYPAMSDNCSENSPQVTSVSDQLISYDCEYRYDACVGRLISQVIFRTFTFVDDKGNQAELVQEICFYKPIIQLPDCKESLDVCKYGNTNPENTEIELAPESIASVPYFRNGACMVMQLNEHSCDVTATYEDLVLPGPQQCGFKIIRTWTILDWCWNPVYYAPENGSEPVQLLTHSFDQCPQPLFSDWQNKTFTYEQHLVVGDDDPPIVQCPDYYYNEELSPFIVSTGPFSCEGSFEVPAPEINSSRECGYTWTVEIWTQVPVLWQGVPTGEYEMVLFSGAQIIEDVDQEAQVTRSIRVAGVPKGAHQLVYVVEDLCGNKGKSDYCLLFVLDEMQPVAICNDDLTISVSSGVGGNLNPYGFGRVLATSINEGSWDNCSDVWLQVRRFVPENCLDVFQAGSDQSLETRKVTIDKPGTSTDGLKGYWTVWEDYVDFVCCDIGLHQDESKVLVELGVWDNANMSRNDKGEPIYGDGKKVTFGEYTTPFKQQDNFNTCWLEVLVEDKIEPSCTAPHDVYLECGEIPYYVSIPEDPNTKWTDLTETEQQNLLQWFGQISDDAVAEDNCEAIIELVDVRFQVHCKAGYIERRFQAVDAWGRESSVCRQRIYLSRHHDYCIKFPKDAEAECLEDPEIPGVELFEYGCDLLAVSVQDERFNVPGSSSECYKTFRTYRVLNWCQFDEDVDPGTPLFDRFDTQFDLEPLIISRDEDEDGLPGDEDVYVRFQGWESDRDFRNEIERIYNDYGLTTGYEDYDFDSEGTYGTTYIDKDCDPFNYEQYDPFDGFWRYTHYSRGFYQYTQVIKVFDPVAPVIGIEGEDRFPSYIVPFPEDKETSYVNGLPVTCVGEVNLQVVLSETCTPDQVKLKEIHLIPDSDLGIGSIHLYRDGVTLEGESFDLEVTQDENRFTLTGSFPIGVHELEIHGEDGCGNTDADFITFTVYDGKAPSPICISGLSTELTVDGNGGGAITVWAKDFLASEVWDCSDPIQYTVHRASYIDSLTTAGETLIPDYDRHSALVLTCEDEEVVPVYVYAWDGTGQGDRCEVLILLNDFNGLCEENSNLASIAGLITTEEDEELAEAEVTLSGSSTSNATTPITGDYTFNRLLKGNDYTITPFKDNDHRNGVSTFDLVVISKHILGTQPLETPYQMIAADVNNSQSISTLDLIQLRRLILSIDVEFRNNTSWRFVDAKYRFQDRTDPWSVPFPEVININNLEADVINGDFIAIKIGDVTGDALVNEALLQGRTTEGVFTFQASERLLLPGKTHRIDLFSSQLKQVEGFQFTIEFGKELHFINIEPGVAGEENFGFAQLDNHIVTASWHREAGTKIPSGTPALSLLLHTSKATLLSEALKINSRYTTAEAYPENYAGLQGPMDVSLIFHEASQSTAGFTLRQNQPNPFTNQTVIKFSLPEAAAANLSVIDISGRTLLDVNGEFVQGTNSWTISKGDLPTTGVLFYRLKTDKYEAIRKMVMVE